MAKIKLLQTQEVTVINPDKSQAPYTLNKELEISKSHHDALLKYLVARLNAAKDIQASSCQRFESIDKELAGYMVLDDASKRRKNDTEKGFGPKPYDINLQLARTQIDEAITYMLSVFFPPEGPYNAIADKEKLPIAKGLSQLMNQHAQQYKHYTHTAKGLVNAFKYNLGLWEINWAETRGIEIGNNAANQYQETKNSVLATGNNLNALDPYNTLLDPAVHPTEVNEFGEFFAKIELHTEFRAKRLQAMGSIYNLHRRDKSRVTTSYYTEKPDILGDSMKGNNHGTDWIAFFSQQASSNVLLKDAIEFVTINIWVPVDENNIPVDESATVDESRQAEIGYQIWRFTIANASVIVAGEPLTNAHGLLPIMVTMPWDDNFERQTQGFGEILLPYQRFASFQMNIHQHAQRKALYGKTYYDPRIFPDMQNEDAQDASGHVPFNPQAENFDIRKSLYATFDSPNTDNTLRDIDNMEALMQKVLPTQQAQQVASLERATTYQAAATVQSGNRRNLKIAIVIDEQAFMVGRRMQLYNIMQFQDVFEVFDKEGAKAEVKPSDIRGNKFEFLVGSGLRGLDKLAIQETLSNILFAIIQSPQATQQIDIVALMNFITTTMGDYTDLNQFKFQNEFDRLTPEQKQMAFQLLQQAMQAQAQQEGQPAAGAPQ